MSAWPPDVAEVRQLGEMTNPRPPSAVWDSVLLPTAARLRPFRRVNFGALWAGHDALQLRYGATASLDWG